MTSVLTLRLYGFQAWCKSHGGTGRHPSLFGCTSFSDFADLVPGAGVIRCFHGEAMINHWKTQQLPLDSCKPVPEAESNEPLFIGTP